MYIHYRDKYQNFQFSSYLHQQGYTIVNEKLLLLYPTATDAHGVAGYLGKEPVNMEFSITFYGNSPRNISKEKEDIATRQNYSALMIIAILIIIINRWKFIN